jgi:hypothetical protein
MVNSHSSHCTYRKSFYGTGLLKNICLKSAWCIKENWIWLFCFIYLFWTQALALAKLSLFAQTSFGILLFCHCWDDSCMLPCLAIVWDGASQTFCPGMILLISAFQESRILDVSHPHLAGVLEYLFFCYVI